MQQAVIDAALTQGEAGIKAAHDREALALKQAPCAMSVGGYVRVLTAAEVASLYVARELGKCKCTCPADVNGDDLPDLLAVSTALNPGGASFRRNLQALLSMAPGQDYGLALKVDYTMSTGSRRIALGDLNRDGFLDVVVSSQSDLVTVRLGIGQGLFGPSTIVSQSLAAWHVDRNDVEDRQLPDGSCF